MPLVHSAMPAQPTPHSPDENMVWIPGGTFLMGSEKHYPEEAPSHPATVEGFWIDRYVITNEQFGRFVEATLAPEMGAKEALALFETAQSEILAVVDPASSVLLGTLGEAYAARRYAEAIALAARGVLDQG